MKWGSICRHIECRKHYKCQRSYCITTRKICDDVIDCPVGDDEAGCEAYSCAGHMRRHGVTYCVPPHEICDGISLCISHCPCYSKRMKNSVKHAPRVDSAKVQQYIVIM